MSSSNKTFWAALPPIFFAMLFAAVGCTPNHDALPVVERASDRDAFPDTLAEDTAFYLCQFSRGIFPNWHQYRQYENYLVENERQAIAYMSNRMLQHIVPSKRAKHLAISEFIAQHTKCRLRDNDEMENPMHDATGAIAYTFEQTYPVVPNIPEIEPPTGISRDEAIAHWRQLLEKSYNGETMEQPSTIVLEPHADGRFYLRTAIRQKYEEPLLIRQFRQNIERYQFSAAEEILDVFCARDAIQCHKLTQEWRSAVEWRKKSADVFEYDVDTTDIQMTTVALTGQSQYNAVHATLTNRGIHTFSNIVFTTDETNPQTCVLQSERTRRDDHRLVLRPGETADAWCDLRSDTRPWTQIRYWISSID